MKTDTHDRRKEFCARLREERQRRDRSLLSIASATKVQASLLEAFERGDVSKWPKGIYRRAFFRDYVTEIGLPVNPHVAEFVELFPDVEDHYVPNSSARPTNGASLNGSRPIPAPPNGAPVASPFRITLAQDALPTTLRPSPASDSRLRTVLQQSVVAAVDIALVFLFALLLSRWTSGLWVAVGIIASVYYTLSTAVLGRSLASELLVRWTRSAPSSFTAASVLAAVQSRLRRKADRAPELITVVEHAALRAPFLRTSLSWFSRVTISSWRPTSRRDRELAELRRRRAEAANRSKEEISGALG